MTSAIKPDERVALVLAGAVAKGAFGVGAVSYIANGGGRDALGASIHRIVGTSSGALTAAVIGAGAATGQLAYATDIAKDLWLNHAAWTDFAHVSFGDLIHAQGLLDTAKLVAIVKDAIQRVVDHAPNASAHAAARVTFITTSLNALPAGTEPLPTYEKAIHFGVADFLDRTKWGAIATAAAASATFPGVFAPTTVDGTPCIDGGAVDNAPIAYALDDPAVRKVIVVTSEPYNPQPVADHIGGLDLIAKLADIVINERVANDLAVAHKTNKILNAVKDALYTTHASEETKNGVLRALGWRELDLVLIHPDPPLPGTSFSGFRDASLRKTYVDAGERAAESALG
jgi:predicted acylesterase/phospholipase RssA